MKGGKSKMRCWSCGTEIAGGGRYIFTCPTCNIVKETKKIRERLKSWRAQSLYSATELVGLGESTEGLPEIASILEWGFEETEWKLDQIRGILGSIDETLKAPGATQANEWRQTAEEMRRRRVLDESEKFFLKSLETNPLDYRTYIGLGKTYLQIGQGKKARTYWEKSLPHAPKGEIDYKSYSYRLIGRTFFCEEDYLQAASILKTSIELSPNYYLGHYDYAQYCALIGDKENCLSSLKIAILKEPIPLELVRSERNFKPLRREIENFLRTTEPSEIIFRFSLKKFGNGITRELDEAEKQIEELARATYGVSTNEYQKAQKCFEYARGSVIDKIHGEDARAINARQWATFAIRWALNGKKELGMKVDKAIDEENSRKTSAIVEANRDVFE